MVALRSMGFMTLSPSQSADSIVVGVAQTLKLYGRMYRSAMPLPACTINHTLAWYRTAHVPMVRMIHSSRLAGLGSLCSARACASTKPLMHAS